MCLELPLSEGVLLIPYLSLKRAKSWEGIYFQPSDYASQFTGLGFSASTSTMSLM